MDAKEMRFALMRDLLATGVSVSQAIAEARRAMTYIVTGQSDDFDCAAELRRMSPEERAALEVRLNTPFGVAAPS